MEMRGKKRRSKANGALPARPKKRKPNQTGKSAQRAKRSVPADSLRWRTAKLPDMTNDAEGFFGLEEVDGVEIIKHGMRVEFVGRSISPARISSDREA